MKTTALFQRIGIGALCLLYAAIASGQTKQIPDSLLPAVSASTAVGTLPGSQVIKFSIGLKPRHPAEMQAYADAVSDPRSPTYRQWLTPAQVGQQFGASPADVSAVSTFLKSKGMTITLTPGNRLSLLVSATVTQIENAFATKLKMFQGFDPIGRQITFRSNATPLKAPSNVVAVVQSVSGVETYTRPYPRNTTLLTPPLTRGLYNTKPSFDLGFNGQGQTVAVSSFDGYRLTNVPLYITQYNLPVPAGGAGSNVSVIVCGTPTGGGGAQGEGDLDIQMELGMAPLAKILIYDGSDRLSVITQEANDNKADVLSESYGWFPSPSEAIAWHNIHVAMTTQGQSYFEATGDNGTTFTGYYPNIEPEILQVGGTVANVNSITGGRVTEDTWSGSTGGWYVFPVPFNVLPSWLKGTGVPTTINFRLNPDVALHSSGGNPFGGAYEFFFNGVLNGDFAGTSFASPMTAGSITTLESRLAANGIAPRLGRMQDLIYLQNGDSTIWHDITTGPGNGILPNGQPGVPTVGWDFVTGWGPPDFDALYNSLVSVTTATPFFPVDVETVLGTFLAGDPISVASSDGIYFQTESVGIPLFGQAAGVAAQFFVPQDAIAVTIDLQANADNPGGTNMVWLFNWNTFNYDLIGSKPLLTIGGQDQILNLRSSQLSLYVGPGGEIDMIVRGHYPIRPFNNALPVPFTYKLDFLELLVRQKSP